MSSLAEIEKAAAALSPQQKQELMLFLGARLLEPRQFSREQVQSWVAQDETDKRFLREVGPAADAPRNGGMRTVDRLR